jgi:hypothetical protein
MKAIPLIQRFVIPFAIFILISCKEDVQSPSTENFAQIKPLSGEIGVAIKLEFDWEKSKNAESYQIVVSENSDFSNPVIEKSGILTTYYQSELELASNTKYFWKVIAENKSSKTEATNAGISFRTLVTPAKPSPGVSAYYVSTSGTNKAGNGSKDKPFKTLSYAASMVPADENDTIFIGPGIFEEMEAVVLQTGVNLIGSGESETILKSSGVTLPSGIDPKSNDYKLWYDGTLIQLVSPHRKEFRRVNTVAYAPANGNQTLANFTIDGNAKQLKAGVWVENRDNVTMHHVTFKNLAQRAAVFAPGNKAWYTYPEYYMKGIRIHHCTFINSGRDLSDETLGNLNIGQLDGAEISDITIDDNEGYGIKFIYDGCFINTKIHDCAIKLNESDSKWGEDIAIELWNNGPGNEISNIKCNTWISVVNHPEMYAKVSEELNMKISNVTMIDADGKSNKESVEVGTPNTEISNSYFENKGIGIAIWEMGRENITVRNNIFYSSNDKSNWAGAPAVYIDNSKSWSFKKMKIYNNVFDGCAMGVRIKGQQIEDVTIKNNLFLAIDGVDVESSAKATLLSHNLKYFGKQKQWNTLGVTSEESNLLIDPGLKLSGKKWDTYYQPTSSQSVVVDAGSETGFEFQGKSADIGRWEY